MQKEKKRVISLEFDNSFGSRLTKSTSLFGGANVVRVCRNISFAVRRVAVRAVTFTTSLGEAVIAFWVGERAESAVLSEGR